MLITVNEEVCDEPEKAEKRIMVTKKNFVKMKRLYRLSLFIFTIKILLQIVR